MQKRVQLGAKCLVGPGCAEGNVKFVKGCDQCLGDKAAPVLAEVAPGIRTCGEGHGDLLFSVAHGRVFPG